MEKTIFFKKGDRIFHTMKTKAFKIKMVFMPGGPTKRRKSEKCTKVVRKCGSLKRRCKIHSRWPPIKVPKNRKKCTKVIVDAGMTSWKGPIPPLCADVMVGGIPPLMRKKNLIRVFFTHEQKGRGRLSKKQRASICIGSGNRVSSFGVKYNPSRASDGTYL